MTVQVPFQEPAIPNRRDLHDSVGEPDPEEPLSLEPDENAPNGYTIDRATGERRPKKRAGRPSKASAPADPAEPKPTGLRTAPRTPDMVPGKIKPAEKGKARRGRPPREEPELPPFRAGPIAKGVNSLYLKAGKIVRVMDSDIGNAIIAITRKEGEDDVTVGEAWEEVAKVNPRIRRVLLRLIEGGAWGQLLMAHVPLLLAVLMKERIARRIPFAAFATSFMDDSDDGPQYADPAPGDLSSMFAGLTQEDVNQAMSAFGQFMPQMNSRVPDAGRTGQVGDFDPDDSGL
jgi:hypothetical protein